MTDTPLAKSGYLRRHMILAVLIVIAALLAADLLLHDRQPVPQVSGLAHVQPIRPAVPAALDPRAAAIEISPATRPTYLDRRFPALHIDDLPYRDALAVLLDIADNPVPLIFDTVLDVPPAQLGSITLHLRDVTFQRALEVILRAAGESMRQKLAYRADDQAVRISIAYRLREVPALPTAVRLYDVRDLLRGSIAFSKSLGGPAPADVNRIVPESPFGPTLDAAGRPIRRRDSPEEILSMDLICLMRAIDPPSWERCAQPAYFAGRIVVEQTPDNHDRIAVLLADLRLDPSPLLPQRP
jgi:hypothetical protein